MLDLKKIEKRQQDVEGIPHSLDHLSDEQLVAAVANGSMWAVEGLYERYHHLLYSLAYRMVNDHHIAEDLLQETFLLLWRHAATYSSQAGAVRPWLFSI